MKTSELTGALLDYWVARAEGLAARIVLISHDAEAWNECVATGRLGDYQHKPSTIWRQGGPIIEREQIETAAIYEKNEDTTPSGWMAIKFIHVASQRESLIEYGPTLLVAAMRAYVASKFGDEVQDDAGQPSQDMTKPCSQEEWAAGRVASKTCMRCGLGGQCTGEVAK